MKSKFFMLLAVLALLIAPAGCIFSPDDDPAPPDSGGAQDMPWPGTADQLMKNFQTIYETRDFDEYRKIMHPDFLTILQAETQIEFPDVGETLDVNKELRIHERMFSGDSLEDPNGDFVPGVANISFSRFQAVDAWTVSPPDDKIPNAEFAQFDVDFLFDRGQEFSTLKVAGRIKFYVTSRDSLHEGTERQYYQMIGQVDLTSGYQSVESSLWGSAKALWR